MNPEAVNNNEESIFEMYHVFHNSMVNGHRKEDIQWTNKFLCWEELLMNGRGENTLGCLFTDHM